MAAPFQQIDIIGGSNEQRFLQFDGERTVNMYIETDSNGKKPLALFPTPGRRLRHTFSQGASGRSLFSHNNKLYAVVSDELYLLDAALFPINLNHSLPFSTSSGHVGIDVNENNQVIFVDGVAGYIYAEETKVYKKISAQYFPTEPVDAIYFDGVFFVAEGNSPRFHASKTNDGLTWDNAFASITSRPDNIVGFAQLNRRLFVFGRTVTEAWYSAPLTTTTANFPLQRDNNMLLNYGCESVASIAQDHGVIVWLSNNTAGANSVMMTDGSIPKQISTKSIDYQISKLTKKDNAIGFLIKISAHLFYTLIFPAENKSYLYDMNSDVWTELEEINAKRWRPNCHSYFDNKHYVLAYDSPTLHEVSEAYGDNDGEPIRRLRISKHLISPTYERLRASKFQLDLVNSPTPWQTQAINTEDNTPEIFLGISDNGGITFNTYSRASIAKMGEYKKRVIWYQIGSYSHDLVFKIDYYSKVPLAIMGATLQYTATGR